MKNKYIFQLIITLIWAGMMAHPMAQSGPADINGELTEGDEDLSILIDTEIMSPMAEDILSEEILPAETDATDQEIVSSYSKEETVLGNEGVSPEEMLMLESISRYSERVLQLEVENGVYNYELVEELVGLGQAYSSMGNYPEALALYNRALHINRVNEGLHNINQLPIVELIIEVNTAIKDYKNLSDNFGYLLWVYSRNFENNDLELVPAYMRAADWHIKAYEMAEHPESLRHLIMSANFYSKAVDIVEKAKGSDDPELIDPLYGIVNANFKLVEPYGFVADIDTFISGKLNPLIPSNFNSEFDTNDFSRNPYTALDYNREHLSRLIQDQKYSFSLIQNAYKSGRNALIRIIEIHKKNPELPELSHAYAHTHTADWYLRFYKRSLAMEHYQQAYQILSQTDFYEDTKKELFSRPRSLGNFQPPIEFEIERIRVLSAEEVTDEQDARIPDENASNDQDKYVLVEFDVTRYGAVRDLRILESNPKNNVRFRRMARNTINSTPFRPRLDNGQPINTENVKMIYRFQ
jgi:tetratricopeptide (TPR) repeat protein